MTSWELLLLFYFGTKKNCRDMSNSTFIVGCHKLKLSQKKKKTIIAKIGHQAQNMKICSIKIYQHINNKNEVEVRSIDKFSKIINF